MPELGLAVGTASWRRWTSCRSVAARAGNLERVPPRGGQGKRVPYVVRERAQPTSPGRTRSARSSAFHNALAANATRSEHLAGDLAELGLTEMDEGRDEYATSEALGAASAEIAAVAVRSAAAGAAQLAAPKAKGGLAQALAPVGADPIAGAHRVDHGGRGKAAAPATRRRSQSCGTHEFPNRSWSRSTSAGSRRKSSHLGPPGSHRDAFWPTG
jgi:hypothetical protein